MRNILIIISMIALCYMPANLDAALMAGVGKADITPPAGTPSAGYGGRMGRGMKGVHDPLLATAVALDNGEKKLAFCGVDHLGMTSDMIQEIIAGAHADPQLAGYEIYIGSSHTHAGGGAFMNFPGIGTILAGKFDPAIRKLYIDGAIKAIIAAGSKMEAAKLGVGYGHATGLNNYRGDWPKGIETLDDVAVIKVTRMDGSALGAIFNYAAHPTVLGDSNMEFSADYVGYARKYIEETTGAETAVFFNGAQADISPAAPSGKDSFERCDKMGRAMADVVKKAWDATTVSENTSILTLRESYLQKPMPNSMGMKVPMEEHPTEINLIVFDRVHAFVTIPGEMSCIYDRDIKRQGKWCGYENVSILGLTNDAHGYIIIPEAWRHKTYESTLSFGGERYGEFVFGKVESLLHALEPPGAFQEDKNPHYPTNLAPR